MKSNQIILLFFVAVLCAFGGFILGKESLKTQEASILTTASPKSLTAPTDPLPPYKWIGRGTLGWCKASGGTSWYYSGNDSAGNRMGNCYALMPKNTKDLVWIMAPTETTTATATQQSQVKQ